MGRSFFCALDIKFPTCLHDRQFPVFIGCHTIRLEELISFNYIIFISYTELGCQLVRKKCLVILLWHWGIWFSA